MIEMRFDRIEDQPLKISKASNRMRRPRSTEANQRRENQSDK